MLMRIRFRWCLLCCIMVLNMFSLRPDLVACMLQAGVAWGMFMGSYDAVKEGASSTFQSLQIIKILLLFAVFLLWFVFHPRSLLFVIV